MTKDTGGAAFPACNEANVNGTMGMTLRDWFAGQALAGMLCKEPWFNADTCAKAAYKIADAMLAERK